MTTHVKDPKALALAQLFSTCVECLLLIHPSKDWDRDQRLLMTKLGIQQGRLLAWGDMMGMLELGPSRDPRLDDPTMRDTIEKALQSIVDRPAHKDRTAQFEEFGLKHPKRFLNTTQLALDSARLESFRERLEALQGQRWEIRRGMSINISHWMVADSEKFKHYLDLIRQQVDFLIGLVGMEDRVDRAMKYDIRALGWHPVFQKTRAASDMSKLRMIKEACATDYPSYSEATLGALEYLDKEWKDNYQEAIDNGTFTPGSGIPGAAAYTIAQSKGLPEAYKPATIKGPGLLKIFRPKSWRKGKEGDRPQSVDDSATRSASFAHPSSSSDPLSPPLTPERSKSVSIIPTSPVEERKKAAQIEAEELSRVRTAESVTGYTTLGPVTSMISRHDQWRDVV